MRVSKHNTTPVPQCTPGQKHMVLPVPLSFPTITIDADPEDLLAQGVDGQQMSMTDIVQAQEQDEEDDIRTVDLVPLLCGTMSR